MTKQTNLRLSDAATAALDRISARYAGKSQAVEAALLAFDAKPVSADPGAIAGPSADDDPATLRRLADELERLRRLERFAKR